MIEVDYLTLDDVLAVAAGVLSEVAVRDVGLLASAVARPQTTVFGNDAYPTLPEKAAALLHAIARNHALVDGNKRLAWSVTRVFLLLNGSDVVLGVDDAEQMVVDVASGSMDVPDLATLLAAHLVG